jgi:hypothetical protein
LGQRLEFYSTTRYPCDIALDRLTKDAEFSFCYIIFHEFTWLRVPDNSAELKTDCFAMSILYRRVEVIKRVGEAGDG